MRTRTPRILTLAAMVGAATLLITGCAAGQTPGSAPTSSADPNDPVVAELLGSWGEDAAGQPHLEFTADGAVTGNDGCNGIFTSFTVEGDQIDLAQFASTLKACEGVDDWLRGVRAVEVDGDVLVAFNDSGEKLGELTRAE
ncbi:META domain-containing protein [Microbacterium sp. A94]|uniref:META domain-containing protein n=1 Tax=Microbacterium sp. A94 TaxID=3450717 RepID=UPI003F43DF28